MGHAIELLDKIKDKLNKDYDPAVYTYLMEKKLIGTHKRFFPDIQIVKEGKIKCIVEIGYTRPEKLSEYKKINIEDVRWYSKEGTLLNSHEIKFTSKIDKLKAHDDYDQWESVPIIDENILCNCEVCFQSCIKEVEEDIAESGEILSQEEIYARADEIYGDIGAGAWIGAIFTNKIRRFIILQCDVCGTIDIVKGNFNDYPITLYRPYRHHLIEMISFDDYLCYKGSDGSIIVNKIGTFDELAKGISEIYGFDLSYDEIGKWEKDNYGQW